MGFVFRRLLSIVVDRRLGLGAFWNRIRKITKRSRNCVPAPIAQLHQAGKGQRVLIHRPREIKGAVVVLNVLEHVLQQRRLLCIQLLDHARPNPHSSFHRHLQHDDRESLPYWSARVEIGRGMGKHVLLSSRFLRPPADVPNTLPLLARGIMRALL